MSLKHVAIRGIRRALGTQSILDQINDHNEACASRLPVIALKAMKKMEELYTKLLDAPLDDEESGFSCNQVPLLIDINDDIIWIPADLLCYLWHTRVKAEPGWMFHFLAETAHYRWIRERLKPGDVAFDCGANLGFFTVMMAACAGPAGKVHSFEPSPTIRNDLLRVLRVNGATNVVVSPFALSNALGKATFCDITHRDVRREASFLKVLDQEKVLSAASPENAGAGDPKEKDVEVDVTTVDAYARENQLAPRLIKIDVEGAEFLLLEGARECIAKYKPLLVIEMHPDQKYLGHNRRKKFPDVHRYFDHNRLKTFLDQYAYEYTWDDKMYYCQ
jgi:FkbM family methyltransferase